MTGPVEVAASALGRAAHLLRVLGREHTHAELVDRARAVDYEVMTAQKALRGLGGAVSAPTPGPTRSTDPATSQAAGRAIATRSGSQRHTVLDDLAHAGPSADWEIELRTGITGSSQRTRRNELCAAGYVQRRIRDELVVTKPSPNGGMDCIVWEITALGRAALAQLEAGQMALAFPDVGSDPTADGP